MTVLPEMVAPPGPFLDFCCRLFLWIVRLSLIGERLKSVFAKPHQSVSRFQIQNHFRSKIRHLLHRFQDLLPLALPIVHGLPKLAREPVPFLFPLHVEKHDKNLVFQSRVRLSLKLLRAAGRNLLDFRNM